MPLLTSLRQQLSRFWQSGFDYFIAPPFCAYCKKFLSERTIFCAVCADRIDPIVSVSLSFAEQRRMIVMAVSGYQEPLKTLILAKAWGDVIASKQLGQLIGENTYFNHMPCDYLVPIPLHWMRFAKRGYNQAEQMAQEIAGYRKVPVTDIIKRVRYTPFQSSLAYDKRLANVKGIFCLKRIDPQLYHNKHLVLVDDLMTTGSTLVAAAKVLTPLKPASINAVVACRVL